MPCHSCFQSKLISIGSAYTIYQIINALNLIINWLFYFLTISLDMQHRLEENRNVSGKYILFIPVLSYEL